MTQKNKIHYSFSDLVQLTKKARIFSRKEVRTLLFQIERGRNKQVVERFKMILFDQFINPALREIELGMNPPFESVNNFDGDVLIGNDWKSGEAIRLVMRTFNEHLFISGKSGSGKSNLIKILISEIASLRQDIKLLIVDWKGEYRGLTSVIPSIHVMRPDKEIMLNPLCPPNDVKPQSYAQELASGLSGIFFLGDTSEAILCRALTDLYNGISISRRSPSIFDLVKNLKSKYFSSQGKDRDAIRSILNRLSFFETALPITYRLQDSILNIETIRENNLILEVTELHRHLQVSLIYSILLQILMSASSGKNFNVPLHYLIVIDEAERFFGRQASNTISGYPVLAKFLPVIRGTGVGMILASQGYNLDSDVLRNINIQICFTQDLVRDDLAKNIFLLDKTQMDYLSGNMKKGECLLKANGINTVLIKVPIFQAIRSVPDEEINTTNREFLDLISRELLKIQPVEPTVEQDKTIHNNTKNENRFKSGILYLIADNYYSSLASIHLRSGQTLKKFYENIKELEVNGLLKKASLVLVNGRGGNVVFPELTDKAWALIKRNPITGKGGFKHCAYQEIVSKCLEKRNITRVEKEYMGSDWPDPLKLDYLEC